MFVYLEVSLLFMLFVSRCHYLIVVFEIMALQNTLLSLLFPEQQLSAPEIQGGLWLQKLPLIESLPTWCGRFTCCQEAEVLYSKGETCWL